MKGKTYSVIIPVYNGAAFVRRSMMSVIEQTYSKWELIVINDGSTDDTGDVVKHVISENPSCKIKYKEIENGGPGKARNIGIEISEGDYICFLDSDDYYKSDFLEKLDLLEEDYDECFFGFGEETEDKSFVRHFEESFIYLKGHLSGIDVGKQKYLRKTWLSTTNVVYKKSFLLSYDLKFPERAISGEDTFFIYAALTKAKKVVCLQYEGMINVLRTTSLSHARFDDRMLILIDLMNNLYFYVRENCSDKEFISMIKSLSILSRVDLAKKWVKTTDGIREFRSFCKEKLSLKKTDCTGLYLRTAEKICLDLFKFSYSLFYIGFKIFYFFKARVKGNKLV